MHKELQLKALLAKDNAINLENQNIGKKGAQALAEILHQGLANPGTKLFLSNCHIGETGKKYFANALKSGQCPENLLLDLSHNTEGHFGHGIKGSLALLNAVGSGLCPNNFTLNLSHCKLNTSFLKHLGAIITEGNYSNGLTIVMNYNHFSESDVKKILFTAIETSEIKPGLKLIIEERLAPNDKYISKQCQDELDNLIKTGKNPLSTSKASNIGFFNSDKHDSSDEKSPAISLKH
jgi:hypothetical protein